MATATPDTIGTVLTQLLTAAADAARDGGDRLGDLLEEAEGAPERLVDDIRLFAEQQLDRLKQLVNPPDWWNLLVIALLAIHELDPDHLLVGTCQVPDWARMLTLTYLPATPDAVQASVTLGLALTGDGQHGSMIRINGALDGVQIPSGGGPLTVGIATDPGGTATWLIPFGGPVTAPKGADGTGGVRLSVALTPGLDQDAGAARLSVGKVRLELALRYPAQPPDHPLWRLSVGLSGDGGQPGLDAELDLQSLLGPLGSIVALSPPDIRYSPRLLLAADESPQFTLGPS